MTHNYGFQDESFDMFFRLSTIRNADEILVMKDGSVVERGTHGELLELDGVYRKLVSKQLDEGN